MAKPSMLRADALPLLLMLRRLAAATCLVLLGIATSPAEAAFYRCVGSKCRASSASSSSSARKTAKPVAKPKTTKIVRSSSSASMRDNSIYKTLARQRDEMAATLASMQKIDIRSYRILFGDAEDVQRLEAIPMLYAKVVNNMTTYVDRALRVDLSKTELADINAATELAKSLVDEFDAIRKHYRCVIEKTCSLQQD